MPVQRTCPRCGATLSPDVLNDLCPKCVGRAAFASGAITREASDAEGLAIKAEIEAEKARLKPEEVGERIGAYRLMEQIGQGGFGTVWVADQERPVRRRVALKIIKLGMDTKEVIARFEQERQALAMMDHPHIAKVFDAGATEWGRPFFVMELVRGTRITDYCDEANLTTAERLALFIQVCNAVQHAHQKGIIHRDLKPSNILVTLHDGVPVPKIIDFGVAKATQQQRRLTDLTIYTQFQQMIGTPLYMSPEQAEMSGLDIDTRSDIYSLGVLLYELLIGRTPFDPEELMRKGSDEIRRTIREQEPPSPSMLLETMAVATRATIAQKRQSDPMKLTSLVRGDLDWIVMKALEKDRNRRYETAASFARDIERHLGSEPVHARPASRLYRFRRFVKRNKAAFTTGVALIAMLLIGSGISIWQAVRAEHEAARANREAAAAREATREAKNAEAAATENLWRSYLEAARATVRTHDSGRRFQALEAVKKAAKIRIAPELRDVAASALMLADIERKAHRLRDWKQEHREWIDFSGDFKSYAHIDAAGHATLRRADNDRVLVSLNFSSGTGGWPWLSSDALLLAVIGRDQVLRVRRWDTGATVLEVPGAYGVAWRPDGERVAVMRLESVDEFILNSGALAVSCACARPHKLVYAPDGSRLAVIAAGRKEIQIFDMTGGAVLQRLSGTNFDSLAWHPDEPILATSGDTFRVFVFNADTGESLKEWVSEGGHVTSLIFSPDGGSLITAGWDTHVRMWNWRTADQLVTAPSGGTDEIRLSPDGRQIATRDLISRESSIYDIATPEASRTLVHGGGIYLTASAFDPRGRWLATCQGSEANLWTSDGHRHLGRIAGHRVCAAAFNPTRPELCVASSTGMAAYALTENPDGTCQIGPPHTIFDDGSSEEISFSPDGSIAAIVAKFDCRIFDTATWSLRARTGSIYGRRRGADFSPDGRWMTDRIFESGLMMVWDTKSGAEVFRARDCNGPGPRFTPDGKTVIAGLVDLRAYDTKTWRPSQRPLPDSLGSTLPTSLIFSPDGNMICTSVMDHIRIARWPSCEPLLELNCMSDPRIMSLAFSPDSRRLLASGALGRVEFVDLAALRGQLSQLGLDW